MPPLPVGDRVLPRTQASSAPDELNCNSPTSAFALLHRVLLHRKLTSVTPRPKLESWISPPPAGIRLLSKVNDPVDERVFTGSPAAGNAVNVTVIGSARAEVTAPSARIMKRMDEERNLYVTSAPLGSRTQIRCRVVAEAAARADR